jgi:hypothetical protein
MGILFTRYAHAIAHALRISKHFTEVIVSPHLSGAARCKGDSSAGGCERWRGSEQNKKEPNMNSI